MFIAALLTIAKTWEQPKCPSADDRLKMCVCVCVCVYVYTHTMKYYSTVKKKNEILPFVATWMDLENVMLSETSQTKTNTI